MKLSMIVEITSLTPRVTLSTPGMAPQAMPVSMATTQDQAHVQDRRQVDRRPDEGGHEGGDGELALDADVEQPHLEGDGEGDAREVERRGPVDDRGDRLFGGAEVPHQAERLDRVAAAGLEHEARDEQGEQHGGDGGQEPQERDGQALHVRRPRRCGRRSCRSRVPRGSPWPGPASATMRPRSITSRLSERPISSSRSADTSSTARPAPRASRRWSQTAAWAPDVDASGRDGWPAAPWRRP